MHIEESGELKEDI